MSLSEFAQGIFIIVNTLISFYIVIYAFIFLNRTKNYPDRKPWEFLFAGAIFFLISQIIGSFSLFSNIEFLGVNYQMIRIIIEFLYGVLILLAFINQSQLILLSDMILITKRVKDRKSNERHLRPDKKPPKNEKEYKELNKKTKQEVRLGKEDLEKEMKEKGFKSEIESEKEILEQDK